MLSVSESLNNAIEDWSDQTPDSYTPTIKLSTLWARSGNAGEYRTVGVESLLASVRAQERFTDCERANDGLTEGMFQSGGGIQTKRNLFQHLKDCGQND